jgi:subtilisin family serine protease
MKSWKLSLSISVFILSLVLTTLASAQVPGQRDGRWTVVFRSEMLPADAAARITRAGGVVVKSIKEVGVLTASGDAAFARRLSADPGVLAIGPERLYSLPRLTAGGRALDDAAEPQASPESFGAPTAADNRYSYQWDIRRIGAPAMWTRVPLEVQGTSTVAVIDSGVMHTHVDLDAQVVYKKATNYCVETYAGSDAYPIYSKLIDFDAHPEWSPGLGCDDAAEYYVAHGTHVAGTIAAEFGGGRVVGVAPGVRIAAYKVFDRYRVTIDEETIDAIGAFSGPVFEAIVDAALRGYPVINMSLGLMVDRSSWRGNATWLAWDRVTKFADRMGTLIVAAAGNEEQNSNGTLAAIPSDLPLVMSTSATGSSNLIVSDGMLTAAPGSDVLAYYSNHGSATDIAAPGGDCGPATDPPGCNPNYMILSTYIFESGANIGLPGYAWYLGTSMASPHVAAVAAVLRAQHPDWTPGETRSYLKETAEDIGPRQWFGQGLVDADDASK